MFRAALLGIALSLVASAGAKAQFVDPANERWAFIDVVGAPGDGEEALENALSNQLLNRGFTVTGTPAAQAYEIQGMVRLFPAGRGEQSIRIDWTIFGPEGMRLGNVTQTNVIPKGSLDRRWGEAAEAAASAAAQDIMQYIAQ
jgi:hypothetical protein